jgi:hypothetical protein
MVYYLPLSCYSTNFGNVDFWNTLPFWQGFFVATEGSFCLASSLWLLGESAVAFGPKPDSERQTPQGNCRTKDSTQPAYIGVMMTSAFEPLGLFPQLIQAVNDLGFTTPTPIQSEVIPLLLSGQDVIGQAHGLRPAGVVGTIAYHADIPGHTIGAIKIRAEHTLVDVPEQFVGQVLAKNGDYRVRKQHITIQRAKGS